MVHLLRLILSGKYLCDWTSMEPLEIIHFTVTQVPPPVRTLNPSVPEELEEVLNIMIAKNKQERAQVGQFEQ